MTILIHSGLGKTATTSLQENVFPKSSNFHYLGKSFALMNTAFHGSINIKHLDDQELLSFYFRICHGFIIWSSNQVFESEGIPTESFLDKLREIKCEIIRRFLHLNDYFFSHERLSFTIAHLNPSTKKKGRWTYPIENYQDLFGFFGELKFLNTTRSYENYFASLYLQLMSIKVSQGEGILLPASYLDAQMHLCKQDPSKSIFWNYKAWSNSQIFSNFLNIPQETVSIISLDDMKKGSITKFLEIHTPLKFGGPEASKIDETFAQGRHKVSSNDRLKQEIIAAIAEKKNIAIDDVLLYINDLAIEMYSSLF